MISQEIYSEVADLSEEAFYLLRWANTNNVKISISDDAHGLACCISKDTILVKDTYKKSANDYEMIAVICHEIQHLIDHCDFQFEQYKNLRAKNKSAFIKAGLRNEYKGWTREYNVLKALEGKTASRAKIIITGIEDLGLEKWVSTSSQRITKDCSTYREYFEWQYNQNLNNPVVLHRPKFRNFQEMERVFG